MNEQISIFIKAADITTVQPSILNVFITLAMEIAVNDKTISLLFHENGQCYANAFVDENHYFDVIGAVSEEEMTEFLNAFTYEKTVF